MRNAASPMLVTPSPMVTLSRLLITGFSPQGYLISAHSDDYLNRPLNTYNYAIIRFLHIEGVRADVPEDVYDTYLRRPYCFAYLYSGGGEADAPDIPPQMG